MPTLYFLYLDDYHAGDVHFLQSLARALAKMDARPAPILVHGSGEHAERMLEANGIFRQREGGVIQIESAAEHALVERSMRRLNQKLVALLTDAVVSSVGVVGTQRRTLVVKDGAINGAGGAWLGALTAQGVVPAVAALARDEASGRTGEIPVADAVAALAGSTRDTSPKIVFFTKTNLPGIMEDGRTVEHIESGHPKIDGAVPDPSGLRRVLEHGLPVLLTNTTRFAEAGGPVGTHITSNRN